MESFAYTLVDRGYLPDPLLRVAVRSACRTRLREIEHGSFQANHQAKLDFIQSLKERPIAVQQSKANEQHYEVSTEFLQSCLGPRMKYSSCLFPTGKEPLAEAEILMLEDYCRKAKLEDGMDILDLGCGWGSLCLFLAEKYPSSRISALSNSKTQKLHIDSQAKKAGFTNLQVYTGDVAFYDFPDDTRFDRVLSIEMFEHMKNYQKLLKKVSNWLKPNTRAKGSDGSLLFIHIFCHITQPYDFLDTDGWMATYFFSGGTMPSFDLFNWFQDDLVLRQSWYIPGTHYAQTLESWLKLQDKNATKWLKQQGQESMLSGQEFFAQENGQIYGLGHYLFQKRD